MIAMAIAVLAGGCASAHKLDTDSGAAVMVEGQPPLEVAKAVSAVFKEAGFTSVPVPAAQGSRTQYRLIFERRAGAGDTILYGDWSLKQNWFRAKVRIAQQAQRKYLVTCDAFRVLNRGDAHFEDEKRISRGNHSQYQKLLEQAVAKLPPAEIERAPTF